MNRLTLARATLLFAALCGSTLFALRTASAELTQGALQLGARTLDLPEEWLSAAPRTIFINGARVRIVTGHSDLPLGALLTRLEASCRARSRLLGEPWRSRLGEARIPALLDGVLRAESEHAGVVGCLDLGERPLGAWRLLDKLARFAEALDVAELGAVRWVRAEARHDGSFFVAALSEGSLPLTTMFPERGDAPGFDLASAGRPHDARRLFSALQEGGEPAISVYETSESAGRALSRYEEQLVRRGFERLARANGEDGSSSALFAAGGGQLLVTTSEHSGRTTIAVTTLARTFSRNSAAAVVDTGTVTRRAR